MQESMKTIVLRLTVLLKAFLMQSIKWSRVYKERHKGGGRNACGEGAGVMFTNDGKGITMMPISGTNLHVRQLLFRGRP